MMVMIFSHTRRKWKVPFAVIVTIADVLFFTSCMNKIPHGGYWSIILASLPFATILIWIRGQKALYRALRPLDLDTFLLSYNQIYAQGNNIPGTGIFFTKEITVIPPYIVHCIFRSNIIYERNVFISIIRTDEPFGVRTRLIENLAPGLAGFEVRAGYMELLDLEKQLKKYGIREKVIFYGIEDISSGNPFWKIFSTLKKQTPNFVQFYNLPASKLQGVVTKVEM
jgi:KUP system potassium uptake protein